MVFPLEHWFMTMLRKKEGISLATGWRDWDEVKQMVEEDWKNDRENMLPRLQHMRTKLFHPVSYTHLTLPTMLWV